MEVTAIVPTLGHEPRLAACLAALAPSRRIVVVQGNSQVEGPYEDLVRLPLPVGFARAVNAGLEQAAGAWVAVVNDDCVVDPHWADRLRDALEQDSELAAVQGINRREDGMVDGAAIGWNQRLEAIQRGLGASPTSFAADEEVFGVSATAAMYRRSALPRGFDTRLGTWYEDVELAARLRHEGWRARLVASAGALHAGGATTSALGLSTARRFGNRWLVLARILGRSFPAAIPSALRADLSRLRHAPTEALAGWCRALALMPHFARLGAPWCTSAQLRSWR